MFPVVLGWPPRPLPGETASPQLQPMLLVEVAGNPVWIFRQPDKLRGFSQSPLVDTERGRRKIRWTNLPLGYSILMAG